MNAFEQVNAYLASLERRLRWSTLLRGVAVVAIAALTVTVLLVLYANSRAFSENAVRVSRVLLYISLAFAVSFALLVPLARLNRRRAARRAEDRFPAFEQRLVTYIDRSRDSDPFIELLAADTVGVADQAPGSAVVRPGGLLASAAAALLGTGGLAWLLLSGPGFLGYGAALLWAGAPKTGLTPYYQIVLTPGNKTVRRGSDQLVDARTLGFQVSRATLFARYRGTSKWEQAPMLPQPSGSAHEFLFAGLPESVEYYVEARGVRSPTYTLTAIDLPGVKKLKVTYRYPSWTALKTSTEDPGGDLRAVSGTEAVVEVLTDRPLANGSLVLDDGKRIALKPGEGNWTSATLRIEKSGMYHVAALESREAVRLSEDYFIDAEPENPPVVRISKPGRDAKVNPLEEVGVAVEAQDDFGLQDVRLHYSVNGGPEKEVPLAAAKGVKSVDGQSLIALEDYKLSPGDLVSLYATARDAHTTSKSDIVFVEAQPYEREYSQSQQMGGGGGGGDGEDSMITQRMKEIVVATFNQIADRTVTKEKSAENARYLADITRKLSEQAKSLAKRMEARQLSGSNQEFQSFTKDMNAAAEAMNRAVDKLKAQSWKEALPEEQKGLQHLQRAEATRRQIQVAFGRGGGGQGGGSGRDLESLFDLELDLDKNQYETGQNSPSGSQQRQVDEALQRLEQLARRQQEAAQQAKNQQTPQQKWQQEMLRREAERLQREMESMMRGQQGQQGSSQQAQGGQSASGSSNSQSSQSAGDARVRQTLDQLKRAMDDMRNADPASARRAADRLREATDALRGMRREQSGNSMDELARRAEQMAAEQHAFADRARKLQPGQSAESLAREKEKMGGDMASFERDAQRAAREMQGSQPGAANRLRDALGEMQGNELKNRNRFLAEWYRRGYGQYIQNRENAVTEGMDRLAEQMRQARAALGQGQPGGKPGDEKTQQALAQVERLREQLNRAAAGQSGQGRAPGSERGEGERGRTGQQGQSGQQGRAQGSSPSQGGSASGERGYGDVDIYRRPRDFQIGGVPDNHGGGDTPQQAMLDAMRELSRVHSAVQDDKDAAQNVQEIMRLLSRMNGSGKPIVLEEMRSELIPQIEQLETQLRRKLDTAGGGQVRTGANDRVAPGYQEAVAEYFRRLSKAR